jgi:hypothetical protein
MSDYQFEKGAKNIHIVHPLTFSVPIVAIFSISCAPQNAPDGMYMPCPYFFADSRIADSTAASAKTLGEPTCERLREERII